MARLSKETERPIWRRLALHPVLVFIKRYAAIEIAILIALATASYFLGRHVFDATVPVEGDVRAHIMKIDVLHDYLSHLSWPQWVPFWYQGIPVDQFYPPGFYFIGAIFTFIFRDAVIAYKLLLLLTLMLNGLAVYFFARRFLKFDSHLAIWCLLAYETSTPMLVNFMYGEGPNLLGWSAVLAFLTVYLSHISENKTTKITDLVLPGFLLGISILIHPFPVIFAAMALVLYHVIWLAHKRAFREFLRIQLPYIAGVTFIGALVGMYYWLPGMFTLGYSSPIYSFTRFSWPGGTLYLLLIIFVAIAVTIVARIKIRHDPRLDWLLACLCLSAAMGFGGTYYLPFQLGDLVQEWRFASIMIPFFGIILMVYALKYRLIHFNMPRLAIAIVIGLFVTAFIFGMNQREAFVAAFQDVPHLTLGNSYHVIAQIFGSDFARFAVAVLPYIVALIYFAMSLRPKMVETGRSKPAYILAAGGCLLLLTTFLPYINTSQQVNLDRIYQYVDSYQMPQYAQIMQANKNGRMLVPMNKGFLTEGDNPVTFGWRWGVETDNGPYNQGDPKFFKFSVHMEWEERWFDYPKTRQNLMLESATGYIFIRGDRSLPGDLTGITPIVINNYGKLLALNEGISYANKVTPILLDVASNRNVTEFFNILMPNGYKYVFTDIRDVPANMLDKFSYVMTDNPAKASAYSGKTVFMLYESPDPSIIEDKGVINLNLPISAYTNQLFYHGDIADGYMWLGYDAWPGSKPSSDQLAVLDNIGNMMNLYTDKLDYTPVDYQETNNKISLNTTAGFTLVKDSYFPYWKSAQGPVISTSQGFMLVYSDNASTDMNYRKPNYYIFATFVTIFSLVAMASILVITYVRNRKRGNQI